MNNKLNINEVSKAHVRNCCLHLATGRTRDDKRKGSGNDGEEKGRNGEKRGVAKKNLVVKRRHGWTMYLNLVTSQYILYFKKCPIEGVE
ncbi:hypothetical protein TNCV_316461 [Trichonephila clavipes]|nr:hypothetical protein TNCV_316461 [Trichonephila clavipes]